jgi:hypothetical protein
MKIDLRTTHAFAEISVDTLSETIFYNEEEMENFINNLITVADELANNTSKSLIERVMYN